MSVHRRQSAAIVLTLLAYSYHVPAAIDNLRFLASDQNTVTLPFTLEPFRPVIAGFGRNQPPKDLFETDRVLAIDDQDIESRSDLAQVVAQLPPGSLVWLEVEHYPDGAPSWTQDVPVTAVGGISGTARYYALFCGILFPLLCLGLAVAVLAAKPEEDRTWLVCALLLFFAQITLFSRANPDQWPLWLQLPAVFYQQAAAWTGPIWIFLLLLESRHGRVPRFQWFHWLLVGTLGVLATVMTVGYLGATVSYAAVEALAPVTPLAAWLASSAIFLAIDALFLFFALGRGRWVHAQPALFRYQWLKAATLLTFAPMIAAFGPLCVGLGRGFDPSSSLALWILVFGSLGFFPLFLALTHLYPPAEPWGTSFRHKVGRMAPWLVRFLDRAVYRGWARAEREIREICAAIPEHPVSLDFLDAVTAGIARVVSTGRVVVFGKGDGMFSPLRSFGYMRPVEYQFAESGSLAEALRREVATGREQFDWFASTDEQLKLHAMQLGYYTPLVVRGELTGFFALGRSPVRQYSAAERRLLTPLAERTAAALANLGTGG